MNIKVTAFTESKKFYYIYCVVMMTTCTEIISFCLNIFISKNDGRTVSNQSLTSRHSVVKNQGPVADQSLTKCKTTVTGLWLIVRLVGDHISSGKIVAMVAQVAGKWQTKSGAERLRRVCKPGFKLGPDSREK